MGVIISILSMERVAAEEVGYEMLTEARDTEAKTVLQRLPPDKSGDDERGQFIVMFLDWERGLILHLLLDYDSYEKFLTSAKELFAESVLDAFDLEGQKVN